MRFAPSPKLISRLWKGLQNGKTLLAGIPMAQAKGRDLVPQHALSQSVALRQDAFPCADLDYASAIAYLRGEAVALPADCPRGYVVVAYRNHPLGFVKISATAPTIYTLRNGASAADISLTRRLK